MASRELDGLRAYAQELSAQYAKLRNGLGELQAELRAVTATATSPDGFVSATVGPRGQLVTLQLDPRIYRKPDSARLAATITETVHRATVHAAAQVEAICARHAPGVDAGSFLRGDLTERFARFDVVHDHVAGDDD